MILLTELESYFKRYPERKQPSKTVTKRQNKQKIWRRKGVSKVAPLKEINYKFSAEDKKYQLFIPKVTFKERGIECPKLKFTKYFRHGLNQKTKKSKGFNI